jgi:hypothetical protein
LIVRKNGPDTTMDLSFNYLDKTIKNFLGKISNYILTEQQAVQTKIRWQKPWPAMFARVKYVVTRRLRVNIKI